MDRRTKLLLIAAISIAVLYLGYTIAWKPWWEKKIKLDQDIKKARQQLAVAKEFLGRRERIEADWNAMEADLRNSERAFFKRGFDMFVRNLIDPAIPEDKRRPNVDPRQQSEQNGDFAEWVVDAKNARFKTHDELRTFLVALYNEEEFVKVRSLNITTQPEQRIVTVDFRLSTIEYSPKAKP